MGRVKVVMPQMGESIAEGTIIRWHKKVGETVKKDEILLEISTDKVDSEIPSPATGVLAEIAVQEQETVPVQTIVAYLETQGKEGAEEPLPAAKAQSEPARSAAAPPSRAPSAAAPPVGGTTTAPASGRFFSPLVLSIAREEGISVQELETIQGSGEGGRVTKKDVQAYLHSRTAGTPPPRREQPAAPTPSPASIGRPVDLPELRAKYPSPDYEVLQMSNVVARMAQHMVATVHTSPHVFNIREVDLTPVVRHRAAHAAEFERQEGFKLTFTPYVTEAVVTALKKYPIVNSSVEGDKIIRKNFIHLGIAVAAENGLIVPVIKHAEEKSFLGLARAVNDLALRTRAKKLTPEDIQGGTFTISNYGVFGTTIGTPLIYQPQVAILGTGAIKKRAIVVNDAIAIRSMAFFTLSFDHRIVDGALGGLFQAEVARYLEEFDPETKL
jgi:pyruvate/2-oxoglutarate dehydrogenase complex dihydrolipoamide acyltransferase (E2) component